MPGFPGHASNWNATVPPKGYTTNFPLTQNPISENSAWISGSVFAQGAASKTDVQTNSGEAYGTMVSFGGTNFVDSVACLSGFGANHEITGTLVNNSAVSGLEVELLLRADVTSAHVFLYELDCVFALGGIHLVRWDMTSGSPNSFTQLRAGQSSEVPYNNGDLIYGSMVGTLVTCKYKNGAGALTTLFTYDTATDGTKYATGNPGIGFWNETGSAGNQNKFGFSRIVANSL